MVSHKPVRFRLRNLNDVALQCITPDRVDTVVTTGVGCSRVVAACTGPTVGRSVEGARGGGQTVPSSADAVIDLAPAGSRSTQ